VQIVTVKTESDLATAPSVTHEVREFAEVARNARLIQRGPTEELGPLRWMGLAP